MYCKNCGKQIENNSRFCNYCGASQGEMRAAEEEKAAGAACAEQAGSGGDSGEDAELAGGGRGAILRWLLVAALFLAAIMGMAVVMPSLLGGLAQKMG